jgi:ArsR family transcriptional regulator, arsenate/arsenite/antimonite-responsive transcriptional repressor
MQMGGAGAVDMIAVAKALGDETRARIVGVLGVRALCVCEVKAALSLSQATVSDHVRVLLDAGLLSTSRESYWTVYSIREDLQPETHQFVSLLVKQVHAQFPEDRARLTEAPVFLCRAEAKTESVAGHSRALHRKTRRT